MARPGICACRARRATPIAGWCRFHGDCVEGLIPGPALAERFGVPGDELPDEGPEWDLFVHDLAGLLHNLVVTLAPRADRDRRRRDRDARSICSRRSAPRLAESIGGYGSLGGYADRIERGSARRGWARWRGRWGRSRWGWSAPARERGSDHLHIDLVVMPGEDRRRAAMRAPGLGQLAGQLLARARRRGRGCGRSRSAPRGRRPARCRCRPSANSR